MEKYFNTYRNKVYGFSDDLVEIEGSDSIEICTWDNSDNEAVIEFDDGTRIIVGYHKQDAPVWYIIVDKVGVSAQRLNVCLGDGSEEYSDVFYIDSNVKSYKTRSKEKN